MDFSAPSRRSVKRRCTSPICEDSSDLIRVDFDPSELPGIVFPTKVTPTDHDPAAIVAFKHLRDKVQTQIKRFRGLRPLGRARTSPHLSDFARLARRLCGASIGVVLGGGGGRGISHIVSLPATLFARKETLWLTTTHFACTSAGLFASDGERGNPDRHHRRVLDRSVRRWAVRQGREPARDDRSGEAVQWKDGIRLEVSHYDAPSRCQSLLTFRTCCAAVPGS